MVVYDLDRTKTGELAALGAEVARDPGELASEDDVMAIPTDQMLHYIQGATRRSFVSRATSRHRSIRLFGGMPRAAEA